MRLLLLCLCLLLNSCAYYFGNTWQRSFKKIQSTEYPSFNERPARISDQQLKTHPLVLHWATKELARPEKKDQRGPERLLLAKLIAGTDVEMVNNYLLESVPWGNSGTSGALNPKGDYDFTSVILAAILHRFSADTTLLWNRTEEHLARVLLVEEGGRPHTKTPRTMGIMKDTENHILITNISQYLKNQWMAAHGHTEPKYNNLENGMEQFLLDNLEELHATGQYEFNSKPYEGYTISALLILHAYAHSNALKQKLEEVLDSWAWEYMQTSYGLRKSAPFRRRMARFSSTSLTDNASTSIMQAWYLEHSKGTFNADEIEHNDHQALSALVYDYRPPAAIWDVDDTERLLLIGHGKGSSPEIHSRGEGFMLSAGGFQRGEASQLVARPIVLMLNDGATDLKQCFRMNGKGKWQQWNNTGVYHRFAVARSAVQVPNGYVATDSVGNWQLYRLQELTLVTYAVDDFGLMYLPAASVDLKKLAAQNTDVQKGVFYTTEGASILFDVKAPKGKWVIQQANGKEMERRTDKWKRVEIVDQ